MPKRFTDTEKWKQSFLRTLEAPYKLLWLYIWDDCDHAGIWQVDFEVARIRIGCQDINLETARKLFAGHIEEIEKFKWYIPEFVELQYVELNPTNRAHASVIALLKKNGKYNQKPPSPAVSKTTATAGEKGEYITVDGEKVFDVLPLLEFYEAALNGRQHEHKLKNWKTMVPEWFKSNLEIDFKDQKHVLNSFSKYIITKGKPASSTPAVAVKKFTIEDLSK